LVQVAPSNVHFWMPPPLASALSSATKTVFGSVKTKPYELADPVPKPGRRAVVWPPPVRTPAPTVETPFTAVVEDVT